MGKIPHFSPRVYDDVQEVLGSIASPFVNYIMSNDDPRRDAAEKHNQVSGWEHIAANANGNGRSSQKKPLKAVFQQKLDTTLPPHKRYIGLTRTAFLWVLLATSIVLLVLIIGLAVGLSKSR